MNHSKFLLSTIIMSMLLAFSPLTHASSTFDRSSEAIQQRDTERIADLATIASFLEQYYQDYVEYPSSKAELAKAFRDYSYRDTTTLDDPLLRKRGAILECKKGYSYEVYPDSNGVKNGAYRLSACMEGNTKLAKEDGGISPKRYERGFQIDKKLSSTMKMYLSSNSIKKALDKLPKAVAPLYQTLSPVQFAGLRKKSYPEGSPSAKITMVQYSDFECSYCLRHRQDGVIAGLKKKYGNDIDFIFKPVNFAQHPGSDAKGYAALCVAKIGGVKKYQEYYGKIMDQSLADDAMFPVENLSSLAQDIGIDTTKFEACIAKEETVSVYQNYTKEAFSLGLSGTPTTIIINNSTREYELVEGAYPIENFEKVVDGLLGR